LQDARIVRRQIRKIISARLKRKRIKQMRQAQTAFSEEHLGFGGYFLFETRHDRTRRGINILARVASLDAALEMLEIWGGRKAF
jgi:hypothetical protein